MPQRVTIRDIAKKLGLHFTTVGRGLRNDSRLSAATIQKIHAAAAKMDYQPDSTARMLSSYRQKVQPTTQYGTLAMLTPHLAASRGNIYLEGAQQRARELGYRVEEIAWREPEPLTGRRLTQILKARGLAGVLVFHAHSDVPLLRRLQLDWSLFPAVALGASLLWPPLHHVSVNHYRNARLLVRKLVSFGYRRIGFFVDAKLDEIRADHGWRAGYLIEMERHGMIPEPLHHASNSYDESAIRQWVRKERLDAVITDYDYSAMQIIAYSGRKVPEELGVASLHADGPVPISGIHQHLPQVGMLGVDLLVQLIRSEQRGIPKHPLRTLLEGSWYPGTTVRRFRKNAAADGDR